VGSEVPPQFVCFRLISSPLLKGHVCNPPFIFLALRFYCYCYAVASSNICISSSRIYICMVEYLLKQRVLHAQRGNIPTTANDEMVFTASARDRVLMLPELLSEVLSCLHNDAPTLAACIRVNKLWAEEAIMCLWQACGDQFPEQGRLPPRIRNLAALAPCPDRLQWYARCIRRLEFRVEYLETDGMRDTPTDASGDEAQYHPAFANTEFPRLEFFSLQGSGYGSALTRGSSLLPYLQPRLLSFSIWEGSISDEFLHALKVCSRCMRVPEGANCPTDMVHQSRCSALKTFVIDMRGQTHENASDDAFADCLQALKSLETLSVPCGLANA